LSIPAHDTLFLKVYLGKQNNVLQPPLPEEWTSWQECAVTYI